MTIEKLEERIQENIELAISKIEDAIDELESIEPGIIDSVYLDMDEDRDARMLVEGDRLYEEILTSISNLEDIKSWLEDMYESPEDKES